MTGTLTNRRGGALATVAALAALAGVLALSPAVADDKVVARVNGKALTEADLKYAETEIGGELGNLPPDARKRVLVEFLIENQLFADAAEAGGQAKSAAFESRLAYWRRRSLRDAHFETAVEAKVTDADAKKYYEEQVAKLEAEPQVKARHILVESEDKAKEIFEKIAHDGDFAELAKANSKDPGSKDTGGDLGWVKRGQTVPEFEKALFATKPGEVALPFKSQFGWHVLKVDEARTEKPTPPPFEALKDRLKAALIRREAQSMVAALRKNAKIEMIDPEVKAFDEKQKAAEEKAAKDAEAAKGAKKP